MNKLLNFFNTRDRFAKANGITLVEIKPGYARAVLKAEERHLNGVDTVQGGALFTLADLAFAAAANSHGTVAVALNVNISFLKAGLSGQTFTAEARENSKSSKIGSYTVEVRNEKNELAALFQGTAFRKDQLLPL
ncbi:MAG: hotdog fold thioesterase [Fibrobacterota bacterium]